MAIVQASHARFDTAYDKSGGEDTVFFAELRAAGAVIVWANDALAHELQDPSRMTLRGYTRRRFESGQRAVLLERRLDNATTTQLAPRRAYRIAHGAAVAAGGLVTLRSDRAARGLGELAFGCGSLAGLVGREPHSYAR